MKNLHRTLVLLIAVGGYSALPASADVYKCVDPDGHVTYTNAKSQSKGCQILAQDKPVSTVPATRTPADFPKVGSDTQKSRDGERRKILDQELATEEKNLEQAKKELAEQEAQRSGDERNYQRVIERLQPFKDRVAQHERNIEALKKEIGNLK